MAFLRNVSALLVALLLCAILATALHNHAAFKAYSESAFSKFVDDLSSGDRAESLSLIVPEFLRMSLGFEAASLLDTVPVHLICFRGPPVSIS